MGRFDALTHLEEEKPSAPLSVVSSPTQKKSPVQPSRNNIEEKQKPEIMISRNHDAPSPIDSFKDKPSKYSTILDASLIKKIKLFAAEKEIKDYEVIELALTEYFNKQHNS